MSYIRPAKGYVTGGGIPGPLWTGRPPHPQHGLEGLWDWLTGGTTAPVQNTWGTFAESASSVPPAPEPAQSPPNAPAEQPAVAPEPPPPQAPLFGSLSGNTKAILIAGAAVAGYLWYKGRKKR